jgi:general secretion pathway protein D
MTIQILQTLRIPTLMHPSKQFYRLAIFCLSVISLSGCFQQLIRDEASAKLRAGNYEAALTSLREGLQKYPDSTLLRAGMTSAKEEVAARIVTESAQLRSVGNFEEADKLLRRGLSIDPKNDRLLNLQSELTADKRTQKRVADIQTLLEAGKKDQALKAIDVAINEAPRNSALNALKRRIEGEFRVEVETRKTGAVAEDKLITLDFRNAGLTVVLEAVTRSSGINFVLDKDIKQDARVTVNLRSIKVNEAISLILSSNQLARRNIDAKTLLIYPNTPEKQKEHQEQVIKVFYLANADVKSTAALLKSMLRIKDAFIDERVSMIVLRETPDIIALAERLVGLHDVAEAEIMLEVEILEIKTSRLTELGVNFPTTVALNPAAIFSRLAQRFNRYRCWWFTGKSQARSG